MTNLWNQKYLIFLFLVLLIISCDKKDYKLYEFDPRNLVENKISLEDIADNIIYIPLDNSYPLGLIYEFYLTNNYIYLTAKDIGVLVFNRKGEFVRKIGAVGRGPGEYTRFTKFTIDDKNGTVYVQDSGNNIKVYSRNGSFIRSLSIQEYGGNIDLVRFFNSKLFVFNYLPFGDAKYNWIILDTLGHLLKTRERPNPIFRSNWSGLTGTYFVNNKLCYWNQYNDTIYTISSELDEKASFMFSPGEHRIPRAEIDTKKLPQFLLVSYIFETERYIFINYFFSGKECFVTLEKRTKKYSICYLDRSHKGGIINKLDGGPEFLPTYSFQENKNEYLVDLVDAYKLKAHVASDAFKNSNPNYPEKKKELEKLADSLKETDNPVLMLVRLKK